MKSIGDVYEQRAADMLTDQGVQILTRNFSRKTGEIDIIALDGSCLIFLEVRVRTHRGYASAAASVDRRKQQRIIRTAALYLQSHRKWKNSRCRFDVIAFEPRQSIAELHAHWIRAAFTA